MGCDGDGDRIATRTSERASGPWLGGREVPVRCVRSLESRSGDDDWIGRVWRERPVQRVERQRACGTRLEESLDVFRGHWEMKFDG